MRPVNSVPPSLSLVIPAFNEADRIVQPLCNMGRYLQEKYPDSEIVVVDDGSTDRTASVVQEAAARISLPLRLFRYAENRGKVEEKWRFGKSRIVGPYLGRVPRMDS